MNKQMLFYGCALSFMLLATSDGLAMEAKYAVASQEDIFKAVRTRDIAELKHLIDDIGGDVNAPNQEGITPLIAALQDSDEENETESARTLEIVRFLLERGANAQVRLRHHSLTSLTHNQEILALLVEFGAQITRQAFYSLPEAMQSPLLEAILLHRGVKAVIDTLKTHDYNQEELRTALLLAVAQGKEAEINELLKSEQIGLHDRYVLRLLRLAARTNHPAVFDRLLMNLPLPSRNDREILYAQALTDAILNGNEAFAFAIIDRALRSHIELPLTAIVNKVLTRRSLLQTQMVRQILDYLEDKHLPAFWNTPLMRALTLHQSIEDVRAALGMHRYSSEERRQALLYAIENGEQEIVETLLEARFMQSENTDHIIAALNLAAQSNHPEIFEMLLERFKAAIFHHLEEIYADALVAAILNSNEEFAQDIIDHSFREGIPLPINDIINEIRKRLTIQQLDLIQRILAYRETAELIASFGEVPRAEQVVAEDTTIAAVRRYLANWSPFSSSHS